MVTEYGMSDKIGPIQFGQGQGGNVFLGRDFNSDQNYSDAIAFEIDQEIQRIIKEQYLRTKEILTEKKELLTLIATTLLEVETLDAGQILHLKDHGTLPERSYEALNGDFEKDALDLEKKGAMPDVTGAPNDPSAGDLPKEGRTGEVTGPIQEDRK
jgi:cell division protease FtsH